MEYIKTKQLQFVAETSFAPVRARAMVLVDFFFPLPGAVVPRFRQTRGSVSPYCFSVRAVVGRRLRSSLLKLLLLTRQAAEHAAVEPRRNELPSFRARRGLSIIPKSKTTLFIWGRLWIGGGGGRGGNNERGPTKLFWRDSIFS